MHEKAILILMEDRQRLQGSLDVFAEHVQDAYEDVARAKRRLNDARPLLVEKIDAIDALLDQLAPQPSPPARSPHADALKALADGKPGDR